MNRRNWVLTPLCIFALASPLQASEKNKSDLDTYSGDPIFQKVVFTTLPSRSSSLQVDEAGLITGAASDPGKAWFSNSQPTKNTTQLISAMRESLYHGLDPQSYGHAKMSKRLHELSIMAEGSPERFREEQRISKLLEAGFVLLSHHLGSGVVDAQAVQPSLHRAAPVTDSAALLSSVKTGSLSVQQALWQVMPTDEAYFRLTDTMRSLLGELEFGMPRTRVEDTGSLQLGDESADVLNLKDRLAETGDLERNGPITRRFDQLTHQAVIDFQKKHGLAEDGVVATETRAKLNTTIEEDIMQVTMSLERWRWMPRDLGARHVVVNIPEFRAKLFNEGSKIVDMGVVVGAVKHKTPMFTKDIKFVETAPTWTVPTSITNKELIPLERRKPGYLASKNFGYFRWNNGKLIEVPASKVTAADFKKSRFPYVLRQRAGDNNALGKLKILMPNKWAIYMHDTQAKKLFKNRVRAYSHGCIRLSDPDRMASMIMQLDGITKDQTNTYLNAKETTRVTLSNPMPAHLTYFTSWIEDDGSLHTRDDIYRYDKKLKRALNRGNTVMAAVERRAKGNGSRLAQAGF